MKNFNTLVTSVVHHCIQAISLHQGKWVES